MQVKVVKFGGSSLADAEHFRQVASIIKADPARRYVVPSAPGKRFKDDIKVTDMLYACYEKIRNRESIDELYEKVKAFGITEIRERTHLEISFENLRNSRYAEGKANEYNLYYIMK